LAHFAALLTQPGQPLAMPQQRLGLDQRSAAPHRAGDGGRHLFADDPRKPVQFSLALCVGESHGRFLNDAIYLSRSSWRTRIRRLTPTRWALSTSAAIVR